jgi:hypothetical protein
VSCRCTSAAKTEPGTKEDPRQHHGYENQAGQEHPGPDGDRGEEVEFPCVFAVRVTGRYGQECGGQGKRKCPRPPNRQANKELHYEGCKEDTVTVPGGPPVTGGVRDEVDPPRRDGQIGESNDNGDACATCHAVVLRLLRPPDKYLTGPVKHKEEDALLGRPVVMDDGIPTILRYHPATVLGSLLAGPGQPRFAKEDALPLPERASLSERLALARRWKAAATLRVARRAVA